MLSSSLWAEPSPQHAAAAAGSPSYRRAPTFRSVAAALADDWEAARSAAGTVHTPVSGRTSSTLRAYPLYSADAFEPPALTAGGQPPG